MLRKFLFLVAALVLVPAVALAVPVKKKSVKARTTAAQHWKGYGFLPGYAPAESERHGRRWRDVSRSRDYYYHGPYQEYVFAGPYVYEGRRVYPGGAGFYRNQWNGGSFGPCYTSTPIGMMWNCGK